MKLHPLNPLDFKFKIIQDLGMIYINPTTKERKRYGLFKCPKCKNINKMPVAAAKKAKICKRCNNIKAATIHGESTNSLYILWKNMKQRCLNKKHPQALDYSKRGITVCTEWSENYLVFKQWALANGYSSNLTLDRKNNDKGYYPTNCRFVTRTVQSRNKRKIMQTNTSGYRGVGKITNSNKYYARITVANNKIHLGTFDLKKEAAKAYDQYVIQHNLEHTING